jgi:hypothetical protein
MATAPDAATTNLIERRGKCDSGNYENRTFKERASGGHIVVHINDAAQPSARP